MQEIAALNKIEDVDFIKAGEELVLPEPRQSLLQEPAPEPVAEAPEPVAEAPEPVVEAPEPVAEAPEPVAEAPEPVAEALKERSEKLPGIVEDLDPDRPIMQVAVRTAGHIAGAVISDIAGETIGTAGRRYVPQDIQDTYDAAVLSVATTLAETETGQKFLKHLEENPGDAKDLEAVLDAASIIPAAGLAMKAPSARGGIKSTAVSLLDAVSAKRQASIRALAGGSLYKTREDLKRQQDIKQYGEAAAVADAFGGEQREGKVLRSLRKSSEDI